MDKTLTREVSLRAGGHGPREKVTYSTHLWRTATRDSARYLLGFDFSVLVVTSVAFSTTAGVVWRGFAHPSILHGVISAAAGGAAVLVYSGIVLAVHLCYRTPKKLCLAKHQQLEEERTLLRAEIDRVQSELAAVREELTHVHQDLPHVAPEITYGSTEDHSHVAAGLHERGEALAS